MALFRRKKATGKPGEWYYCLKDHKVEEGPECPALERLGPYPTAAEAARAIDTAEERNEEWEQDPRWNDQGGSAPRGTGS
ncbi:hypothetical protein [Streptomyces silvisoli]|uniref:SPOR domain-containing protein n=1 Tax=Streptomyces silvisoli TaxID=3034235 RepID=A0ABT5ZF48_9ACTN|nr:hypothetical protein [Streptomyces silvisoli]MDF3288449.1 hypothetical protein [Streptomyces silvisoli]